MLNSTSLNDTLAHWIERTIHKWSGGEEELSNLSYGAILVVLEMTLTLLSIVLNLVVIISIREKESLLNSTLNLILGNLCFSNLMAAVFVKSIAIIYNGYAVASRKWSVELAFCTVHTLSSRATWAVLPYTVLVLSWLFVINRATRILGSILPEDFCRRKPLENSSSFQEGMEGSHELEIMKRDSDKNLEEEMSREEEEHEEDRPQEEAMEEELSGVDGLGALQKSILGFIWFISLIYSFLSPQIFNKTSNSCLLRDELDSNLNVFSFILMVPIPLFFGPVLCFFSQIFLSFCECIRASDCLPQREGASYAGDSHFPTYNKLTYTLLAILTLIFALEYPLNMFFVEQYLAQKETIFAFMLFKYVIGYMHILLIPLFIILMRKDILHAALSVFSQKSVATQKEGDITFEQFQTHCGMGVNPT